MAEKRKFIRFDVPLNAVQLHEMLPGPPETITSRVTDISRGGLRLIAENQLPKGSSVNLEMNIPGDNFPIFALSEVMWSRKVNGDDCQTGLRFKDIKSEDKMKLLEYAYAEWRKIAKQKPVSKGSYPEIGAN